MPDDTQMQTLLGQALAASIAERGPITFADYMAIALYHPDGGYYTSNSQTRQGWSGDYLTSSDLHPLFGAAIGRQLAEIWELLDRPDPFTVLEDGAGRGLLGRDIAEWAAGDGAQRAFASALRYRCRDAGANTWEIGTAGDPLAGSPPQVILSNELIDALPVHRVQCNGDALAEIYVDVSVDAAGTPPRLIERLGPPSSPEVATYLDSFGIPWRDYPDGWSAEVNLSAMAWMRNAAAELAPRGVILTIDYGDRADRLYTPERRLGTILGYRQHRVSENLFEWTGEQDITAHVNFSALIAAGEAPGLQPVGLVTQRDFLIALGLQTDAERLGRERYPAAFTARHTDDGQRDYLRLSSLRHRIAALLDADGMGGFRVLVQQRGLTGRKFQHL